jgi:hypothetical protein
MIWLRRASIAVVLLAFLALIAFVGFALWVVFIEIALERGI